jgi:succinoglycan biosynthesis protein ExoO
MSKKPLVSIVMANRNGARYLGAAISSVLGQSLTDLELILSDDGSTDASLEVAETVARGDPRLRVIAFPSASGPGAARNRALAAARGNWIAVVDSDDLIHPARFERLLARAEALEADIVADDLVYFGSERGRTLLEGAPLSWPWTPGPSEFLEAEMGRPAIPVGYLKPVLRRGALGSLRYREDMTVGEDFDMLFRAILAGARLAVLPEAYYFYRRHRASISHRLSEADAAGMVRASEDLRAVADGRLAGLLDRRRALHARAGRFAALIRALKEGDLLRALPLLAREPGLVLPLARALREGAARRASRSVRAEDTGPLCLLGESEPAETMRAAVRALRVPEDASLWTPDRAARLSGLAGDGSARLEARGRAGLEALGYVPGWAEATLFPPDGGWTETERRRIAALPWPVEMR